MSAVQVVVMGPSGVGKTTVGRALASELAVRFIDGDDLHTPASIAQMAGGAPLSEQDRSPWLEKVARSFEGGESVVVACSALAVRYRDVLRAAAPNVFFVELDAGAELLAARMEYRDGHFMPTGLIESQLATLEHLASGENGVRLDASWQLEELVEVAAVCARENLG
jgi:carbohydrate kinase (thermoresistant glucokinase family)